MLLTVQRGVEKGTCVYGFREGEVPHGGALLEVAAPEAAGFWRLLLQKRRGSGGCCSRSGGVEACVPTHSLPHYFRLSGRFSLSVKGVAV